MGGFAMKSIFGHFSLLTAALLLASFAGCKGLDTRPDDGSPAAEARKETYLRSGYACCNLHYSGDWISDSNLAQLPFIPAGTPIKVKSISGYRAYVEVDGKAMRLGHDYGRAQETTEQWVNKVVVLDDPKLKIAKFPPAVRNAIARSQLMKGMTTEQVVIAVGYPQTDENPRLDGPFWRYWWSSFGPYTVHWSGNKVSKIDGHPETVGYMTYSGK
jgi:hypothetical protein